MEDENKLILCLRFGEKSIVIGGADSPYQLLSSGAEGLEAPEAAPSFLENAQLDGSYLTACRVPGRDITLHFEIADHAMQEVLRRELISFFAPKAAGTLIVMRGGVTRQIGCRLFGRVSFTQETMFRFIRVRVPLFCPDPYFSDEMRYVSLSQGYAGMITFPLTITAAAGLTAGLPTAENHFSVENAGDTETGFSLSMSVIPLPGMSDSECSAVNPVITLDNTRFIRILTTLHVGDVLTVCTIPGQKQITKNGERCMLFSRDSTFFPLPCGRNTLSFSAETLEGCFSATVGYCLRYYGV